MSSHLIRGRQLSRDTEHRNAMRKNLVQSLFEHGQVRTTFPKAKEVQGLAEKLITLARQTNGEGPAARRVLNARRRVIALLGDRRLVDDKQEFTGQKVVQKLFSEIAPKFTDRPGGYTRIIKLAAHRIGDGGSLVQLQLMTVENAPAGRARRSAGLRRKRNERRHQFAAQLAKKDSGKGDAAAPAAAPEAVSPAPASQTPPDATPTAS
jgi:large subunit ribosomal protein L17